MVPTLLNTIAHGMDFWYVIYFVISKDVPYTIWQKFAAFVASKRASIWMQLGNLINGYNLVLFFFSHEKEQAV